MRLLLLLAFLVVAGCATRPVEPSLVTFDVEPITQKCESPSMTTTVLISIRNEGRGRFRIPIDDMRIQPPYHIGYLNYEVLDVDGKVEWKHSPGGHGLVPVHTLSIGHNDATKLLAHIYYIQPVDHTKLFRIRFRDDSGNFYTTKPFYACLTQSTKATESASN